MQINHLKTKRAAIAVFLPVALICLLAWFSFSRIVAAHTMPFSAGITFDLIFTVPLLHFLLARGSSYLKYSLSLFFTAGLLVASTIIPAAGQFWLHQVKLWIVPAIEISVISVLVIKTRQAAARHRQAESAGQDFYSTLKAVSRELLPKRLAAIVTAELGAFYYGFCCRRKPVDTDTQFSYHKKTSTLLFIGIFIFMILLETTVFHLLVARLSVKAAWVLTSLSLYAALQAFGIARSVCMRPVEINGDRLIIPYGILADTAISLHDVLSIEIVQPGARPENAMCISPFKKMEEPDVLLKLGRTYTINGIYGSEKAFEALLIRVDEQEKFISAVLLLLHRNKNTAETRS